ncbi:hypothetical protein D9756_009507 [Leucocoprinus leucothites]|uniref:Uncharacterized protein n=1 Tax=Leucocoprinus leucothites TaxID=201217 RepID=A0A8H5FU43_9AGAR|nr:hypothetical protein D9756_009507 [Leucoagaricus leucothites]
MSSPFSWADRVNVAVNTCLPCLQRTSSTDSLTNSRSNSVNTLSAAGLEVVPDDDLRRLLVESDSDALSLHSSIGISTTARARRKAAVKKANAGGGRGWGITVFGYHLFGRPPQPPIHLPTSPDDDDPLHDTPHSHHTTSHSNRPQRRNSITATGSITRTTTLHSTATFDSDAAPLDAETINSLSDATSAAALALAEEEERRAKEERRKRRREKREMKKIARALAAEASIGDEFEGFQGSGGTAAPSHWPAIPQAFMHEGTDELGSRTTEEDKAPSPTELLPHLAMKEDEDDEGADLDGMTYARRRRPPPSASQNGGSDSRSRTTTSTSTSHTRPTSSSKPSKKKSGSSKKSSRSKSTLSSNDSTSLASPTSPAFGFLPPHEAANTSIASVISPTTVEQGQGLFDYRDDGDEHRVLVSEYTPSKVKDRVVGGFPSIGFGVRAGAGATSGAFLANTDSVAQNNDEGDDSFDGTF